MALSCLLAIFLTPSTIIQNYGGWKNFSNKYLLLHLKRHYILISVAKSLQCWKIKLIRHGQKGWEESHEKTTKNPSGNFILCRRWRSWRNCCCITCHSFVAPVLITKRPACQIWIFEVWNWYLKLFIKKTNIYWRRRRLDQILNLPSCHIQAIIITCMESTNTCLESFVERNYTVILYRTI